MALTAWEQLDNGQGVLFGILIASRNGAAEAAYGTLQSPAARGGMVITAANRVLKKDNLFLDEITDIVDKIGKLSGRRNDIAHGMVSSLISTKPDGKGGTETTDWGHFLVPGYANTRKQLSDDAYVQVMADKGFDAAPQYFYKYAYTAGQIATYARHFAELRERLMKLIHLVSKLARKEWPQRELLMQQYEQQIRELQTKLNAQEHGQPPQSSVG